MLIGSLCTARKIWPSIRFCDNRDGWWTVARHIGELGGKEAHVQFWLHYRVPNIRGEIYNCQLAKGVGEDILVEFRYGGMYPREHRNDMVQFTKNEANGEVGVGSRLSECYLTRPEGEGVDDRSLLRLLVSWAQGSNTGKYSYFWDKLVVLEGFYYCSTGAYLLWRVPY